MKRIAAILFLLVILFNLCGYRFVLGYMQKANAIAIEGQVDRNEYTEAELITIKTPLNLPYYSSSPEFERTYGSITINGYDYEYVKRRVYNDTLELLCLPNKAKTKLSAVGADLAKAAADGQTSAPSKQTTVKIGFPDYCQSFSFSVATPAINAGQQIHHAVSPQILSGYLSRLEQPPRYLPLLLS